MNLTNQKLALGLLFSLTAVNAQAALTAYNGAGSTPLVYSSVSNVTWTGDANLLGSLISSQGYNTVVNAIIAASPTITDTPNFFDTPPNSGSYNVSTADFSNSILGRTSWFGAKAFTTYLNSINYGGSNAWRLPTSNAITGYNGTAGNELGQLFYSELGGTANNDIPNTSYFTNEQTYPYWSGTEYAPDPSTAWGFDTYIGVQGYGYKGGQGYAWAVSPGQVAAVPLPGAVWLMGSGLLGLLASKRRGHAG